MTRSLLILIVATAIVMGAFFRFYHLDHKVVWSDEVYSQLHVAGLTESDVVARAAKIVDVRALRAYFIESRSRLSGRENATIHSLVVEDPQHTPLFFIIERYWVDAFGGSIGTERMLPALIGVLSLPIAYWLAIELFQSAFVAWIFVALMAISPFFTLYSQENREYTMWEVSVLVLSACALRAIRLNSASAWITYTVAIVAALYTDALSLAVVGAHAVYFIVTQRDRLRRTVLKPSLSIIIGVIAFAPWLVVILRERGQIYRGMAWVVNARQPAFETLRIFFGEWSLSTVDLNLVASSGIGRFVTVVILAAIGVALIMLVRHAKFETWTFVLCVGVSTVIPLLSPDLISGGQRSANPRYFVPLFICIELALAYALTHAMRRNVRWGAAFATIVAVGIVSSATSSQAQTWWSKYNEQSIALAELINRSNRPILVSDNYVHFVLSIAPYLRADTRLALAPKCYLCATSADPQGAHRLSASLKNLDDVFLLGPSYELNHAVRSHPSIRSQRIRCIDVGGSCAGTLKLF